MQRLYRAILLALMPLIALTRRHQSPLHLHQQPQMEVALSEAQSLESDLVYQVISENSDSILTEYSQMYPECLVEEINKYLDTDDGLKKYKEDMGPEATEDVKKAVEEMMEGAGEKLSKCITDAVEKCAMLLNPTRVQISAKPIGCTDLIYKSEKLVWIQNACIGYDEFQQDLKTMNLKNFTDFGGLTQDRSYIQEDLREVPFKCTTEKLKEALKTVKTTKKLNHLEDVQSVIAGVATLSVSYEVYTNEANFDYLDVIPEEMKHVQQQQQQQQQADASEPPAEEAEADDPEDPEASTTTMTEALRNSLIPHIEPDTPAN